MGLPMIIPSMYLMVLALFPIIFLETYVVAASLRLKTKKVLAPVAIANMVSTFIGIPVTWFFLVLFELVAGSILGDLTVGLVWQSFISVTVMAPWVAPTCNDENWIIFGAMLFLLIPYGLASWGIEYLVVRKKVYARMYKESLKNCDNDDPLIEKEQIDASPRQVSRAVRNANLASYALLAFVLIVIFATGLAQSK